MAEISDAQVVLFANEHVRPHSNALVQTYHAAKHLIEDYNAGNIGTLISNAGSSNLITDGSSLDGRTRITGGDVFNLITAATAFIAFMEASSNTNLNFALKPHTQD